MMNDFAIRIIPKIGVVVFNYGLFIVHDSFLAKLNYTLALDFENVVVYSASI